MSGLQFQSVNAALRPCGGLFTASFESLFAVKAPQGVRHGTAVLYGALGYLPAKLTAGDEDAEIFFPAAVLRLEVADRVVAGH